MFSHVFAQGRARTAPVRGSSPGVFTYLNLMRQRRTLAGLDAHQLRDIGLDRDAADAEARRPIWDVPAIWMGGRP